MEEACEPGPALNDIILQCDLDTFKKVVSELSREDLDRQLLAVHALYLRAKRGERAIYHEKLNILDDEVAARKQEDSCQQEDAAQAKLEEKSDVLEPEESCPICLEGFEESVTQLRRQRYMCSHSFHKKCIAQWALTSNECPCCRAVLKPGDPAEDQGELVRISSIFNDLDDADALKRHLVALRLKMQAEVRPLLEDVRGTASCIRREVVEDLGPRLVEWSKEQAAAGIEAGIEAGSLLSKMLQEAAPTARSVWARLGALTGKVRKESGDAVESGDTLLGNRE